MTKDEHTRHGDAFEMGIVGDNDFFQARVAFETSFHRQIGAESSSLSFTKIVAKNNAYLDKRNHTSSFL